MVLMVGSESRNSVVELGTSRRDLKKLCTPEPSHPDMQVEKTFLNEGEVSLFILDPNAFW